VATSDALAGTLEAEVFLPVNPFRQAPTPEQLSYATDLCESELEFPQRTIDRFPAMSRYELARLISNLKTMRARRLAAQPRDRRWRLVL
jgi:hypothetical protein